MPDSILSAPAPQPSRPSPARSPYAITLALIAINVLVFLAMGASGISFTEPTPLDVARWGGDEFFAIARNVNLQILNELAQRCVVLISETSIPTDDGRRISLSVSVGAALSRHGESAEDLFRRVDGLVYQSKTDGRGRATTE